MNVARGQTIQVANGQHTDVGGDAKTTVKGSYELRAGNVEVHSRGEINFNAAGIRNDSSEKLHFLSSPYVYLNGKAGVEITAGSQIKLQVGSASITLVDGKITLAAPLVELNP